MPTVLVPGSLQQEIERSRFYGEIFGNIEQWRPAMVDADYAMHNNIRVHHAIVDADSAMHNDSRRSMGSDF
eukprot:scaffold294333_cov41-Prasinocladus_malaysianus.AAC.1